jgi:hypothetical protein
MDWKLTARTQTSSRLDLAVAAKGKLAKNDNDIIVA